MTWIETEAQEERQARVGEPGSSGAAVERSAVREFAKQAATAGRVRVGWYPGWS